jgi:hypothetical protein
MQADEDSWSARSSRSRISNQTDIGSIRDIVKAASDNQISSVFFSVLVSARRRSFGYACSSAAAERPAAMHHTVVMRYYS